MKYIFKINVKTDGDFCFPFVPAGMNYDGEYEYKFEKSYKDRDIAIKDIIYICNSFFITYHLYHKVINQNDGSYQRLIIFLVTNYVFASLFPFVFFTLHNLFLSYLTTLFSFVTILLSMMEASLFNKKLSLLLLPNVLWTLFATIISIMYYLEN
jgi:tryptophan-rich sensory protein